MARAIASTMTRYVTLRPPDELVILSILGSLQFFVMVTAIQKKKEGCSGICHFHRGHVISAAFSNAPVFPTKWNTRRKMNTAVNPITPLHPLPAGSDVYCKTHPARSS